MHFKTLDVVFKYGTTPLFFNDFLTL